MEGLMRFTRSFSICLLHHFAAFIQLYFVEMVITWPARAEELECVYEFGVSAMHCGK